MLDFSPFVGEDLQNLAQEPFTQNASLSGGHPVVKGISLSHLPRLPPNRFRASCAVASTNNPLSGSCHCSANGQVRKMSGRQEAKRRRNTAHGSIGRPSHRGVHVWVSPQRHCGQGGRPQRPGLLFLQLLQGRLAFLALARSAARQLGDPAEWQRFRAGCLFCVAARELTPPVPGGVIN